MMIRVTKPYSESWVLVELTLMTMRMATPFYLSFTFFTFFYLR